MAIDSAAQQDRGVNTFQAPQVVHFAAPVPLQATAPPQVDPATLIRIPVTVVDDSGRCVDSLSARDFSLSIDGQESPIAMFRADRATTAALGVLVDISQSMGFRSSFGGYRSKLPFIRDAIERVIDQLDAQDNVFLAAFARRFHIIDDFTTDHDALQERLSALRVTDELDDFNASGIYNSLIKGITVLTHAPKGCERRALLVFTDGGDTGGHGADDVIARAQFAGVTIFNVIVQGYSHEMDALSIRNGLGRIAAETGGLTFIVNGKDESVPISTATAEIVSELDNQYVLGFSPSQWSSGAVPVELMLPHHPGMRARAPSVVRFRPENFAPGPSAPIAAMLPE
ncbi:MAG TPA: VWA domain-containing protein [Candidatus Binataceae bacterium]|nr:VWA domain-containing protein [Candidatus Binataceae bacterium]